MSPKPARRHRTPIPGPFRPRTRWAAWEDGVLSRVPSPTAVQQLILQRQQELDDDAAGAEAIVEYFRGRIRACGGDPTASGSSCRIA